MKSDPTPVTAAGGVVRRAGSDDARILLMRRRGEWDLPKGKLDPGESIESCALREVAEETGLTGLILGPFLTHTRHRYEDAFGSWDKTTHWYLMSLEDEEAALVPQAEEQIVELEWVTVAEAMNRVRFASLRQVLDVLNRKGHP
jgi:8-oxo-dGTP pyrophosphatase MutT (NUDIX family)